MRRIIFTGLSFAILATLALFEPLMATSEPPATAAVPLQAMHASSNQPASSAAK